MAHDSILIADFGSQVTQLIARRVREQGVYSEICPYDKAEAAFDRLHPKGLILSGSPASVLDDRAPLLPVTLYHRGIPILGICYGQQLMAHQLGGAVEGGHAREFGHAKVKALRPSPLIDGVWEFERPYGVWMSHGDRVVTLPPGFQNICASEGAPMALIADEERHFYGSQFHLEVAHTPDGTKLIENFVRRICGCRGDWSMRSFREEAVEKIRRQVGSDRVICAVSGGVDSTVTAWLIHEAIGDGLTCVFVDNGLLRLHEAEQVVSLFRDHFNIPLVHVEAGDRFLSALSGVTDPEKKRKIIGATFIEVFEREAARIEDVRFLGQGTLYPDVVESVSVHGGPSASIKAHHNVGGLPAAMKLKLVEPLRELFKDEVRALGRELGLPGAFITRQPFPGPGLAIRCPGEVTKDKLDIIRRADDIYITEITNAGVYNDIWQAFAGHLPVHTVGVMGDRRTYEHAVGIRAVTSTDGMTADVYRFDWDLLLRIATRIYNEVPGVNRVFYDITRKPPGTIEWE